MIVYFKKLSVFTAVNLMLRCLGLAWFLKGGVIKAALERGLGSAGVGSSIS